MSNCSWGGTPTTTRRGRPHSAKPHHNSTPICCHEPLLVGWTGVLCEDGRARGTEGTSDPTTRTRHCEQLLAWGIAGAKDHEDGRGDRQTTGERGAEDKRDNGEGRARPRKGGSRRGTRNHPHPSRERWLAGWARMLTNTGDGGISYLYTPTPSTMGGGLLFLLECCRSVYYCRNICKMTINSNYNLSFHCQFGRVVRVTYCAL
jgi:hypothetical protein